MSRRKRPIPWWCVVKTVLVALLALVAVAFGWVVILLDTSDVSLQVSEVVFQRHPEMLHRPVTIVFGGDTMLGDHAASLIAKSGLDAPLAKIKPVFSGADFGVLNLETALTDHHKVYNPFKKWHYKTAPASARVLRAHKVLAVSVANNHALDFGVRGFTDTLRHLSEAGLVALGGGEHSAEAYAVRIIRVGKLRLALLAFMEMYGPYYWPFYWAQPSRPGLARLHANMLTRSIAVARQHADLVVVYPHWGRNYKPVTAFQKNMARLAIQSGADLVIGHHPHTYQPIEIINGKPVFYSLGNFVFGTRGKRTLRYSLVVRLEYGGANAKTHLTVVPIMVQNRRVRYRPRPCQPAECRDVLVSLGAALAEAGVQHTITSTELRFAFE